MIEIIPNWHPVFVHFTVALLIIAATIHLLSHFLPNGELANQLTIVARWNLWLGVGFTLLTVAAGWYAYNTVSHDAPSHIAMVEHRNWAMATFALLLGISGWEYYLSRHGRGKGWLFTALLVIAAALLLSTAWHGGEQVLTVNGQQSKRRWKCLRRLRMESAMKKRIGIIALLLVGVASMPLAAQADGGYGDAEKNRTGQPSRHGQGGIRGSCKIAHQAGA